MTADADLAAAEDLGAFDGRTLTEEQVALAERLLAKRSEPDEVWMMLGLMPSPQAPIIHASPSQRRAGKTQIRQAAAAAERRAARAIEHSKGRRHQIGGTSL